MTKDSGYPGEHENGGALNDEQRDAIRDRRARIADVLPADYPVQPNACPECSTPDSQHHHAGAELGYICVGCPCERRPRQPMPEPHDHEVGVHCGVGCPAWTPPASDALDADAHNRVVGMLVATGELEVVGVDVEPTAPDGSTAVKVELDRTSELSRRRIARHVRLKLGEGIFELSRPRRDSLYGVDVGPDPNRAEYHTIEFRDSRQPLSSHPPDWYDGKPKKCPGSGLPPGVQFHGEVSDDGEPKYLCRCPWCDKAFKPGPMPEHTFIPVRAEDLTFKTGKFMSFKTGKFMYGMERDEDPYKLSGPMQIKACTDDVLAKMAITRSLHRRPRRPGLPAPSDDDLAMSDLHAAAELGCHCSGFMCTMHCAVDELAAKRPPVVVLVGGEGQRELVDGYIAHEAFSGRITLVPVAPVPVVPGGEQGLPKLLDTMLKRQLDIADELFVLNAGGLVSAFAAEAVAYAELCGIPVRWLESPR